MIINTSGTPEEALLSIHISCSYKAQGIFKQFTSCQGSWVTDQNILKIEEKEKVKEQELMKKSGLWPRNKLVCSICCSGTPEN